MPGDWRDRALAPVGITILLGIAWLLSSDRRRPPWRLILWGLGLQAFLAWAVLRTPPGRLLFQQLNVLVQDLLAFTQRGSQFLFGSWMQGEFVFVLQVLPTIIFFSSLMAVLFHLGLMQRLVGGLAWGMRRTLRTTGPETLNAAANVFVGMTEAPLLVRPYLPTLSRSELMAVMVAGFGTASGGIMGAYVACMRDVFPDIAGHILAASVISAPGSLLIAKIMLPASPDQGASKPLPSPARQTANVIDAAAVGASEGMRLAVHVAAVLLAFIALLALVDHTLAWLSRGCGWLRAAPSCGAWSLEGFGSWLTYPLVWAMRIPLQDRPMVAALLAKKVMLNELAAFQALGEHLRAGATMHPRSIAIASYALCGFANLGSIAIQIGGIGSLAPERRAELSQLGLRAMVGGLLAVCLSATIAGVFL